MKHKRKRTPTVRPNGYCLGPFNIDETAWYYTEPYGVLFVGQLYGATGKYQGTIQKHIPWNDIRNALAIKDHGRRVKRVSRKGAKP